MPKPCMKACLAEARKVALEIASKSPVAVVGTKVRLGLSQNLILKPRPKASMSAEEFELQPGPHGAGGP